MQILFSAPTTSFYFDESWITAILENNNILSAIYDTIIQDE